MERRQIWLAVVIVVAVALAACLFISGMTAPASKTDWREASTVGLLLGEEDAGVYVLAVREGSGADKLGLQPGDVLITVNGTSVENCEQVDTLLENYDPEAPLELCVRRDNEELCLTVD